MESDKDYDLVGGQALYRLRVAARMAQRVHLHHHQSDWCRRKAADALVVTIIPC
jgi:hypothetical protein